MITRISDIEKIIHANTHDPFNILGMHKVNSKQLIIRVFHPAVKSITIISDHNAPILMDKIHPDGFFEKTINSDTFFRYKLKYESHNGHSWEIRDPYSFSPIISEYDLYLFNQGNHHRIYNKLGAHIMELDGVEGTYFSVWAPDAQRVSIVGNFNNWDGRTHQMRVLGGSGVWELFIPGICEGDLYRFEIKSRSGSILLKSDPYAFLTEKRPANASVVWNIEKYSWNDKEWIEKREKTNWLEKPISVYELHPGSWMRTGFDGKEFLSYRDLAERLVPYLKNNNYTHVEFMPLAEHPLDESWGYQVTGYYSATSRYGTPEDLMYLIDILHQNGIGIILDWVPGHFPKDAHGLGRFDGSGLYEHIDPRLGEHQDWGTYIFNYGRNEVKNFLIANALFWFDKYHIDGLRVDAVASMIYLDYSRKHGEWIPNKFGGRENLEAIEFLKYFNSISHQYYPGIITIAEESTAWSGVSRPTYVGGLGFSMKWNMGWMHDTLEFIEKDSIYRKYHQNNLTFSLVYAFTENFQLVISHDEVVYGKKSMLSKMPGDDWQKFANLRAYYTYMFTHPGKKLMFMGSEFGQWNEWNCTQSLDWHLLNYEQHQKMQNFVSSLNKVYKEEKALWEDDFTHNGFEWIDYSDAESSTISYIRKSKDGKEFIVCILNFTPVPRLGYRIGVPVEGEYAEIINSDSAEFFGSDLRNYGILKTERIPWHRHNQSLTITLPPLAGIMIKYIVK